MGLFSNFLAREQRSSLKYPSPELIAALQGGAGTAAGVTVSPSKALTYAAVFSAVRLLSEGVAALPLFLYERQERGRQRASEHSLYRILHSKPNAELTAFEFWRLAMEHLTLWGNFYAEIEMDGAGRTVGLWPLRPDRMQVVRRGGQLVYLYSQPQATLTAENVFHLRGLGSDGVVGYSPITLTRQTLGLGLAAEQYGSTFFGNGARPGMVLEHPGKLGDDAYKRLKDSWEGRHQGLSNAHRVAILEEGMGVKEVGMPPEDAQFLETRKFQVTEVARIFRVPPHKLADLERATFSNIEHQSIEFVTDSLRPWLVCIEQRIGSDLLLAGEQDRYYAEFLVDGLLRGDTESRYQAYATARQWGWMSANDVRELENLNPVEGGDVYMMPLNMVPAGDPLPGPAPKAGEGGDEDRMALPSTPSRKQGGEKRGAASRHRLAGIYRSNLEDVAQRVVNREINDVRNGARKHLPPIRSASTSHRKQGEKRGLVDFDAWLREFYDDHLSFVIKYLHPVLASYAELVVKEVENEVGGTPDAAEIDLFIQHYVDSRAGVWVARNRTRIARAAREAEQYPLAAVEDELADIGETVAAQWASDQAIRAANAVALTSFILLGITKKRWVAFGDNCPYCDNMNGVIVEVNKHFLEAGTEYQPDGAEVVFTSRSNIGHPPMHNGCDCMVVAA